MDAKTTKARRANEGQSKTASFVFIPRWLELIRRLSHLLITAFSYNKQVRSVKRDQGVGVGWLGGGASADKQWQETSTNTTTPSLKRAAGHPGSHLHLKLPQEEGGGNHPGK